MTHCDRCLLLEQQVRELKRQLAPAVDAPPEWGFTSRELVIFDALSKGGVVSKLRIALLLWSDSSRLIQTPEKTIEVHIWKMRRKLAQHGGAKIITHWGVGYQLVWPEVSEQERAAS